MGGFALHPTYSILIVNNKLVSDVYGIKSIQTGYACLLIVHAGFHYGTTLCTYNIQILAVPFLSLLVQNSSSLHTCMRMESANRLAIQPSLLYSCIRTQAILCTIEELQTTCMHTGHFSVRKCDINCLHFVVVRCIFIWLFLFELMRTGGCFHDTHN